MSREARKKVPEPSAAADALPLYQKIAEQISAEIKSGALAAGDKLKSEPQLSKLYSVSRVTVRRAIALLEAQGLTVSRQGMGTFVSSEALGPSLGAGGEGGAAHGQGVLSVRVLSAQRVSVKCELSELSGLEAGAEIIKVERVLCAGRTPVVLERCFFPCELSKITVCDLTAPSLVKTLESEFGIFPDSVTAKLRIKFAGPAEIMHLSLPEGTPLVCAFETVRDSGGAALLYTDRLINTEKYTYTASFRPRAPRAHRTALKK